MLKLKPQYFGHLMQRTDSLNKTLILGKIEGRSRRGWHRMRWLDSITDSTDLSLSKLWDIVRGHKESDTTVTEQKLYRWKKYIQYPVIIHNGKNRTAHTHTHTHITESLWYSRYEHILNKLYFNKIWKQNQKPLVLNDLLDQIYLGGIYRTFIQKQNTHSFKISLGKLKKTKITSSIIYNHSAMKLEINYKKKLQKQQRHGNLTIFYQSINGSLNKSRKN